MTDGKLELSNTLMAGMFAVAYHFNQPWLAAVDIEWEYFAQQGIAFEDFRSIVNSAFAEYMHGEMSPAERRRLQSSVDNGTFFPLAVVDGDAIYRFSEDGIDVSVFSNGKVEVAVNGRGGTFTASGNMGSEEPFNFQKTGRVWAEELIGAFTLISDLESEAHQHTMYLEATSAS